MKCSVCGKEIDTKREPFENFFGEFFCYQCALERAVEFLSKLKTTGGKDETA